MNEPQYQTAMPTTAPLSIVIPVYNESSRILASLATIWTYAQTLDRPVEVIVVDDGSADQTALFAKAFSWHNPNVLVIAERHRGKASAVLAGLHAATGSIVGFMDVDLATPLDTLHPCIDAIEHGFGVAIGSREGAGAIRIDEPQYRHVMGRAFNMLVRLLLLPGIQDTQCGFKFFSRAALDDILPRYRLYRNASVVTYPLVTAFDVELLYIARRHRYRIRIVPVTWHYSEHSKVDPVSDTIQNVWDVLRVRFNGWFGRYR